MKRAFLEVRALFSPTALPPLSVRGGEEEASDDKHMFYRMQNYLSLSFCV